MLYFNFVSGMYGKNSLEGAYIDQILDTFTDLIDKAIPYFIEKDEALKVSKTFEICKEQNALRAFSMRK